MPITVRIEERYEATLTLPEVVSSQPFVSFAMRNYCGVCEGDNQVTIHALTEDQRTELMKLVRKHNRRLTGGRIVP